MRSQSPSLPSRTLLFVDDHDILYRAGVARRLRPLDRCPQNPVLPARDKPWEINVGWVGNVYHSDTGLYQLWYQAFSGPLAQQRTHRCVVCYAESTDGIHWTKPDLDLYEYNGIRPTNIVMIGNAGYSDRYSNSVLFDPRDPDPARRYKMATYDFCVDDGVERPGLVVAFSPDGIHWNIHPQAPLLRASYGEPDLVPYANQTGREWWDAPLGISDAMDVIYDPKRDRYVIYCKMWLDGPVGRMYWKHAMGRTESCDFIHWSRPELVLAPDEFDPLWVEFHHSPAFYYNDCYFALLQILHREVRGGIMDAELAISRDGLHWKRPFRTPHFLPRGAEGTFDCGSILTNAAPVMSEDEFRFFYGGYAEGATGSDDTNYTTGIGMASMPRDRFAALYPQGEIGQVTLRPLDLTGCQGLTINASAVSGSVQVEVLNADGYRVRGFGREDALPVTGDGLRLPARWHDRTLADLPDGAYMLRLYLQGAELYAATLLFE